MAFTQKTIAQLSLAASILGLLQGSLWFLGAFFSILIYHNLLQLNVEDGSIFDAILDILCESDRTIIIFLYVYAVFSITLCTFSTLIIPKDSVSYRKNRSTLYIPWIINISLLCVIDIVFTCFLGRDLSDLFYFFDTPPTELFDAYMILLLISMRGIFIWIANIIIAGYLTVSTVQLSSENEAFPTQDIIKAFDESVRNKNKSKNPLARLGRKESWHHGKATVNSNNSTIKAVECLSINSEIFRKREKNDETFANIDKSSKRSPPKSQFPLKVPCPVPPPLLIQELRNEENSKGDHENIDNYPGNVAIQNTANEFHPDYPDYPYIPPPDYSPLGSPHLNTKFNKNIDFKSTAF